MSNYNAYIGNKKALKFPVMCDGYIELKYADNIATNPYGIWEHEGDFTIESLITPYDVNGYGDRRQNAAGSTYPNGVLTSDKTMPASDWKTINDGTVRQDENYLPLKFRTGYDNTYTNNGTAHKMLLFKSDNTELYLANATTHNHNQPAEYKIVFKVKLTTTHTLESPVSIRARDTKRDLGDTTIQYMGSIQNLQPLATVTGSSYARMNKLLTLHISSAKDYCHLGMKLYDSAGYYIGVVTVIQTSYIKVDTTNTDYTFDLLCNGAYYSYSVTHPTDSRVKVDMNVDDLGVTSIHALTHYVDSITSTEQFEMSGRNAASFSNVKLRFTGYTSHTQLPDSKIYSFPDREPVYTEGLYHVAAAYDEATGKMVISLNGSEVAEGSHIDRKNNLTTRFTFGNGNIYLAQDGSLTTPENRKTQFMGELHEFSITKNYNTSYSSLYTLLPQYRNLLFYLNFEEEA